MINPTLFIGLGTQGLDILEELQKLVLEEYGQKPPIFEYLYIDTDEKNKPSVQNWVENEINVPDPFPVIRDLNEKRREYEEGKHEYLRPWLNEELLYSPYNGFTYGTANIRMAGRLCLWLNWSSFTREITSAKNKITEHNNREETVDFLIEFYTKVGKNIDPKEDLLDPQPHVYIFGTLCGGTCGGMFIDMAYLTKYIFRMSWRYHAETRLKGIFTVFDQRTLRSLRNEGDKRRAANCWTSLMELDYFSHRDTSYKVIWPDRTEVRNSDPPFDYFYLLSCSGNKSNLRLRGEPDIKALNHMAAMVLFSETVSDLHQEKRRIMESRFGLSFNTPYCETPKGRTKSSLLEDMPIIASCGMAAVWYPKYRISEAAACLTAKRICEDWLGVLGVETKRRIETQAKDDWENTLTKHLPGLTYRTPAEGGPIEDDIKNWFLEKKESLSDKPLVEVITTLKDRLKKFGEEQEYDKDISRPEQLNEFAINLKKSLREKIIAEFNNQANLSYAQYYLERLIIELSWIIESLPPKYPLPEVEQLNGKVSVDGWAKFVLRRKDVARQKIIDLLEGARSYFLYCLLGIRQFRAKTSLENVQEYLATTLKKELRNLETTLCNCTYELEKRAEQLSEMASPQNMKLIFAGNNQREDINRLHLKLHEHYEGHKRDILDRIMAQDWIDSVEILSLMEFLKKGKERINSCLVRELRLKALDLIGKFNIAQKLMLLEDSESIRHFAQRAEPYLELADPYLETRYGWHLPSPHFLMGLDDPGAPSLTKLREDVLNNPNAANRIDFGPPIVSSLVDHLLIFYQEKGLLYKNKDIVAADLFKDWYQKIGKDAPYGLFTHKGGEIEFDPAINKRLRKIERDMAIVTNLFFQADGSNRWKKSSVLEQAEQEGLSLSFFKLEKEILIMEIETQDGSTVVQLPNQNGIAFLARDSYAYNLFRKELAAIMEKIGEAGFVYQLNDLNIQTRDRLLSQGKDFTEVVERTEQQRNQFRQWKDEFFRET